MLNNNFFQGLRISADKKDYFIYYPDNTVEYFNDGVGTFLIRLASKEVKNTLISNFVAIVKNCVNDDLFDVESIYKICVYIYGQIEDLLDDENRVIAIAFKVSLKMAVDYVLKELVKDNMTNCQVMGLVQDIYLNEYESVLNSIKAYADIETSHQDEQDLVYYDYLEKELVEFFKVYKKDNALDREHQFLKKKDDYYPVLGLTQLFIFEISRLKRNGLRIKRCEGCGHIFIPKRKNARYCLNPSQECPEISCREYFTEKNFKQNHQNNKPASPEMKEIRRLRNRRYYLERNGNLSKITLEKIIKNLNFQIKSLKEGK